MEYLEKMLKKTGIISIIESLVFIVLGAILVWKADFALKVISYVLGFSLIITGGVKIIRCIRANKDYFEFYNYELIYGLMAIVIGIITIYYSSAIETILRVIIGIWIIYSSFIKLSLSLKIKTIGQKAWIYSLILAIIMFVCGLYIILNSGTILATIGIIMIIYSIIDIIEDIISLVYIKEVL